MATSKIDLISAALVLIGDKPVNSLTGNDRRQQVANALYDSVKEAELSKHRWGFARKKAQLSLTTETPVDDEWQSIYQLPTDLITLIKLKPNVNYQVLGDKVYTNLSQALYCDYIYNTSESEFPAYFTKLMQYALAVEFSTSIRDSSAAQANMASLYNDTARMARYTDSQQHPQTPIQHRPFINVRF